MARRGALWPSRKYFFAGSPRASGAREDDRGFSSGRFFTHPFWEIATKKHEIKRLRLRFFNSIEIIFQGSIQPKKTRSINENNYFNASCKI